MAASTAKVALTDQWTRLSTDETSVAVQLLEHGTILVYLGETAPEDDSNVGVLIGNESAVPRNFSASGIPDGASVWARAQDEDVAVVVMKY